MVANVMSRWCPVTGMRPASSMIFHQQQPTALDFNSHRYNSDEILEFENPCRISMLTIEN
jgi:hypothetical protein